MDSENNFESETQGAQDTNSPQSKFAEYGKKGLAPFLDLIGKYKSDIVPYSSAINRALDGAINALNTGGETNDVNQTVVGWFQGAKDWFAGASSKLDTGDSKELFTYFEEQSKSNPALAFGISYAFGILFGRIGKYAMNEGSSDEQQIH